MNNDKKHDFMFKLVIVGEAGVGKTSLLVRYTENAFTENYKNTIGCDFMIKSMDINGKSVMLQMWDTSGQERFRALASSYYRNANGLVIVYDVTCMDSFKKVTNWLRDADYYSGNTINQRVLIGNKTDKTAGRVVDFKKAKALADSFGMSYIETSAKDNTNVSQTFETITHRMMENYSFIGWTNGGARDGVIRLDNNATEVVPEYSGYCCSYI